MTTNQLTRKQSEKVIAAQESDRAWFETRPARTHRLRPPTADELLKYGTKTTHVIVSRRGKAQLARVTVTLVAGSQPIFLELMVKLADIPADGVLDFELAEVAKTSKAGKRINLESIFFKASSAYR